MNDWEEELAECRLCPRNCGVNRLAGETGVCGQTAEIKAARASLHMWEEPCISGTRGSGTVFFSGCSLHCVYCQNGRIANGDTGYTVSRERLAEIFLALQEQGANNINLVTAGHFLPQVAAALMLAKDQGLVIPVVYNTGGYELADSLRRLEGLVDVYLPDMKYAGTQSGSRYSAAPDYFIYAKAALAEMVRQTGECVFVPETVLEGSTRAKQAFWKQEQRLTPEEAEERGEQLHETQILVRGTIVRHLLLPGMLKDSKRVIRYLLDTYGNQIYISLMSQYTPAGTYEAYPELNRKVTGREYERLVDHAIELGIERGFIQEGDVAEESFIPEFDGRGIL